MHFHVQLSSADEVKDPLEELDEELRRDYGACPLCGKKMLAQLEDRQWCKNCGWRKKAREAVDSKGMGSL